MLVQYYDTIHNSFRWSIYRLFQGSLDGILEKSFRVCSELFRGRRLEVYGRNLKEPERNKQEKLYRQKSEQ